MSEIQSIDQAYGILLSEYGKSKQSYRNAVYSSQPAHEQTVFDFAAKLCYLAQKANMHPL
jgi:hypothetical protein